MNRSQLATLANEIEQSRPDPEWDSIPELKKFKHTFVSKSGDKKVLQFDALVVRYKELSAEIDFRESAKKEIKEAIETALSVADTEVVLAEGYKVSMITKQGNKKVSVERLLGAGVQPDVIARCTEVGPESRYVKIAKAKEEK